MTQSLSMDLYMLINPVLFWMNYSIESNDRLPLFKTAFKALKDVSLALPPTIDINIHKIMLPILQRVSSHLSYSPPTLNMLRFLEIVLKEFVGSDYRSFFADFALKLAPHVQSCFYEELNSVIQILFEILGTMLDT